MDTAKVSAKGWVVIPKALRDRYGIEPGSTVAFVDYGGVLVVVPRRADAVEAAFGSLRRPDDEGCWTQAYLEDKRAQRDLEEGRLD